MHPFRQPNEVRAMSANALPVITVHGHASNPGTVTELTVYERALERS